MNEKKNQDVDNDEDENKDDKLDSSKKTINISYEPKNYKKNRTNSLNNLIAMLTKREPVNEDLEVGTEGEGEDKKDSDEEERKKLLMKIANSIGTEGNIAGINPYEPDTSKQPSKFKKMFLKMLKKNQYKKED